MVLVLHRAREGLWPILRKLVPVRVVRKTIDADAEPLPRRTLPKAGELILEAKDVTRKFGGLVANNNMSLEVRAGEILALIGPNGAGKSTMFNQISGVDTPTSGEVLFLGKPVAGHDSREIARMGMSRTFQHVKLLPTHERARERRHRRAPEERQGRAELGLAPGSRGRGAHPQGGRPPDRARGPGQEHMYEEAGSLALGQQRILEIARALCADPCLLLLDEPAAGLRFKEKEALGRAA